MRAVGQKLDPQVADRVPERAPDPVRKVVRQDVPLEHTERLVTPGHAIPPDLTVGAMGLLDQLVDRPASELHAIARVDPLPLAHFPRVGVQILD